MKKFLKTLLFSLAVFGFFSSEVKAQDFQVCKHYTQGGSCAVVADFTNKNHSSTCADIHHQDFYCCDVGYTFVDGSCVDNKNFAVCADSALADDVHCSKYPVISGATACRLHINDNVVFYCCQRDSDGKYTSKIENKSCVSLQSSDQHNSPSDTNDSTNGIGPTEPLSKAAFDMLNPLLSGSDPQLAKQLSTPGGIISRVLTFAFPIAGFILFIMLVWGGFEIMTEARSQKMENGKKRITAAIMGFLMLFLSYWLMQIIFLIFGIEGGRLFG